VHRVQGFHRRDVRLSRKIRLSRIPSSRIAAKSPHRFGLLRVPARLCRGTRPDQTRPCAAACRVDHLYRPTVGAERNAFPSGNRNLRCGVLPYVRNTRPGPGDGYRRSWEAAHHVRGSAGTSCSSTGRPRRRTRPGGFPHLAELFPVLAVEPFLRPVIFPHGEGSLQPEPVKAQAVEEPFVVAEEDEA